MSPSSNPTGRFGTTLRTIRETKGLTQSELAERSGLQPSAVSHFEAGRRSPSFDNLRALADALGVSTDYLLGRDAAPGLAGPTAEKLFRHAGEVTDDELRTLAEFAEMMAAKHNKARDPKR
jgi:transcriptional regulator with XRE-family HTH domain